jgi:hypothetical protein
MNRQPLGAAPRASLPRRRRRRTCTAGEEWERTLLDRDRRPVQAPTADCVREPTGFDLRSYRSDKVVSPSAGFVDGSYVERFLDLGEPEQDRERNRGYRANSVQSSRPFLGGPISESSPSPRATQSLRLRVSSTVRTSNGSSTWANRNRTGCWRVGPSLNKPADGDTTLSERYERNLCKERGGGPGISMQDFFS